MQALRRALQSSALQITRRQNLHQSSVTLQANKREFEVVFVRESGDRITAKGKSTGMITVKLTGKVYAEQCLDNIQSENLQVGSVASQQTSEQLLELLNRHRAAVAMSIVELGQTSLAKYEMTGHNNLAPDKGGAAHFLPDETTALRNIVKQLLNAGFIIPSTSPSGCPVFMERTESGNFEMYIDYRQSRCGLDVEKEKEKKCRNLFSQQSLAFVEGKNWFSVLDLGGGYFQVPMANGAAEKAAFVTPEGCFHPLVMMRGLCGAPHTFQSVLDKILEPDNGAIALPYPDGLIVASGKVEEHIQYLDAILTGLNRAGLTVILPKCNFLTDKVSLGGLTIDSRGIRPEAKQAAILADYPTPRKATEFKGFLSLVCMFRHLIPNVDDLVSSLKSAFAPSGLVWSPDSKAAFNRLQEVLSSEPVVASFDPLLPTEVHTDASNEGAGAVLLQQHRDGWRMVDARNWRFSPAERKYKSSECEFLAVVRALEAWRFYLHGVKFTVVSDCEAVALGTVQPTCQFASWLNLIGEFSYKSIHRSKNEMLHVDALSRISTEARENQYESARCPLSSIMSTEMASFAAPQNFVLPSGKVRVAVSYLVDIAATIE